MPVPGYVKERDMPNIPSDPVLPSIDEEIGTQESVVVGQKKTQSLDYVMRSGLAGGVAGCVAKSLIAPLDRIKILFQASNPHFTRYAGSWTGVLYATKAIYSQDGIFGLYQGHSATLLRIFPYAAIKFVAYEQFRHFLIPNKDSDQGWRRFMAGSLAGITSVMFTYPLEVIRVRLAYETQRKHSTSFTNTCWQIYHERGHSPIYSTRIPILMKSPNTHLARASSTFASSALPSRVLLPITGIRNFYSGFTPTLVGMLPYAGVSFWVHDIMGDLFRSRMLRKYTMSDPSNRSPRSPLKVWSELTAGGFAGLMSQTASYPLEVIRRRMQVAGVVVKEEQRLVGMFETARSIWLTRGFPGFFVGLSIGYVKIVPMVSCSFLVYERMKLALGI